MNLITRHHPRRIRRNVAPESAQQGLTLMGLMMAVTILGTLMAIAIPNYRQYIVRTNRTDARVALMRISVEQEKYYILHNAYASSAELDQPPPNGLGIEGTERGYYELTIDPDGGGLASGYTARAVAKVGEPQFADEDCREFTVDSRGTRAAHSADGTATTALCSR